MSLASSIFMAHRPEYVSRSPTVFRQVVLLFLRFYNLYGNRLVFKTIIQIHEGVITFPGCLVVVHRGCTSASYFCSRLLSCIVSRSGSVPIVVVMARSTPTVWASRYYCCWRIHSRRTGLRGSCCCYWQTLITSVATLLLLVSRVTAGIIFLTKYVALGVPI